MSNWYIECGGLYNINNQPVFGRNIFIDYTNNAELNRVIKRFNNRDVYCTNYLYDNKDQNNSKLIGPLYIDLDNDLHDEESFNKVREDTLFALNYLNTFLYVPKEYINLYFSGNKGFHIIVSNVIFGITPCNNLNEKYKALVNEIKNNTLNKTIDTRIYDKKRLIRLPHSINSKTGLYKVPISEDMLRNFSYKDIIEYAKTDKNIEIVEPKFISKASIEFTKLISHIENDNKNKIRNKKNNAPVVNPNYEIPICIKYIYNKGCHRGNRNNTLVVLASSLFQKGMSLDECIELLTDWNYRNEEPLSEFELVNTIKSAYRMIENGMRYGCASIKDLGYCLKEQCKIYIKDIRG